MTHMLNKNYNVLFKKCTLYIFKKSAFAVPYVRIIIINQCKKKTLVILHLLYPQMLDV